MTELGYNYRLPDINAALGESQLARLTDFINARHRVVELYRKEFADFDKIILPKETSGAMSAWHLFVIRTTSTRDRLPLYRHLQKCGIGVNFHYPAVYSHPYYRKNGFAKTKLPNMDIYHNTAITIPLYADLTKTQVKYIVANIKEYFAT